MDLNVTDITYHTFVAPQEALGWVYFNKKTFPGLNAPHHEKLAVLILCKSLKNTYSIGGTKATT